MRAARLLCLVLMAPGLVARWNQNMKKALSPVEASNDSSSSSILEKNAILDKNSAEYPYHDLRHSDDIDDILEEGRKLAGDNGGAAGGLEDPQAFPFDRDDEDLSSEEVERGISSSSYTSPSEEEMDYEQPPSWDEPDSDVAYEDRIAYEPDEEQRRTYQPLSDRGVSRPSDAAEEDAGVLETVGSSSEAGAEAEQSQSSSSTSTSTSTTTTAVGSTTTATTSEGSSAGSRDLPSDIQGITQQSGPFGISLGMWCIIGLAVVIGLIVAYLVRKYIKIIVECCETSCYWTGKMICFPFLLLYSAMQAVIYPVKEFCLYAYKSFREYYYPWEIVT